MEGHPVAEQMLSRSGQMLIFAIVFNTLFDCVFPCAGTRSFQVSLGRLGPCNTLHERQRDPEKPSQGVSEGSQKDLRDLGWATSAYPLVNVYSLRH